MPPTTESHDTLFYRFVEEQKMAVAILSSLEIMSTMLYYIEIASIQAINKLLIN